MGYGGIYFAGRLSPARVSSGSPARCVDVLDFSDKRSSGVGGWDARLERCPECERDLVQPATYEPLWGDRWLIALDCPNCHWQHEGVWPHAALRRYEEHLDEVDDRLWDALVKLERERMEEEVRLFSGALATGLILPEDF